jgi:hypothetical protein
MNRKLIATVGLASALAAGSASVALAGPPDGATGHGAEVSAVAKAAGYASGKARGEAVSAIAKVHGAAVSAAAKAMAAEKAAAGKAKGAEAAANGQANGSDAAEDQSNANDAAEPGLLRAAAGGSKAEGH